MQPTENTRESSHGVQAVSKRIDDKVDARSSAHGNSHARIHGGKRAKYELKELKRRALDGRTTQARLVRELEAELISAFGGEDQVSPQQRWVIQRAAVLQLQLSALDAFVLGMDSLVNKKRRQIYPIVLEHAKLSQSLTSLLTTLGLNRQAKPALTLSDYLAAQTATKTDDHDTTTTTTTAPATSTTDDATAPSNAPDDESGEEEDDGADTDQ